MKTTKQVFIDILVNFGMFESDATTVTELLIPKLNELVPGYKITWDKSNDYPSQMFDVWFVSARPFILDWIIQNRPKAWYKLIFE